jgi:hypothetical protein
LRASADNNSRLADSAAMRVLRTGWSGPDVSGAEAAKNLK